MGKKANQLAMASTKTSKNEKQLHSLIKDLRPKVYITDSSSFKLLVQELTGYRSRTTSKPEEVETVVPVIEIEDDQGEIPAATTPLYVDSSFSSFELCDQIFQSAEEIYKPSGLMQTADDFSTFDQVPSLLTNQQMDWLACQNLESWLLDAEPYSCFYTQREQEVSLFDYELAGLV